MTNKFDHLKYQEKNRCISGEKVKIKKKMKHIKINKHSI